MWQWLHSAPLAEEEVLAAGLRRRQAGGAALVAVVEAVAGDQGALEARDRLHDVAEGDRALLAREGGGELRPVAGVAAQAGEDGGLVAIGDPHLDRPLAEQGHLHLPLERHERRVGPGQGGVVDDVRQGQGAARMGLAGRSDRLRPSVGERLVLVVAAAARLRAVARQAGVVEEEAAEVDLLRAHGVARRHLGRGEPGRQLPRPGGRRRPRGLRLGGRGARLAVHEGVGDDADSDDRGDPRDPRPRETPQRPRP